MKLLPHCIVQSKIKKETFKKNNAPSKRKENKNKNKRKDKKTVRLKKNWKRKHTSL